MSLLHRLRRVSMLRLAGLFLAMAFAALPLAACSDDGHGVLHTGKGDFAFGLEVVDTPKDRERGLMFRQSLAPDAGMLFDFKIEQQNSFWMQNTFIPLDMVFIAADGIVKTIHVNARPMDVTPIPSQVPVRFVLEIAGGRSVEIGLKPGDRFEQDRVQKSP